MKRFLGFLVALGVAAVVVWFIAGKGSGPAIVIASPGSAIGQNSEMRILIQAPEGRLTAVEVELEQGDTRAQVFTMRGPDDPRVTRSGDTASVVGLLGRQHTPELQEGDARLIVRAARPVFFGLQQTWSDTVQALTVKLTPPRVGVLSRFHYINHGGSEMVVYNVSPGTVSSGVRVGDQEYAGFPASGAGVTNADSSMRVAFFALLWDQDANTPINVFARDEAGNEGTAGFDKRVFAKVFRQSRINLDDAFLNKVVPAILQNSPNFRVDNPSDLLAAYLRINGDMRRENGAQISALTELTASRILWEGAFRQLTNSAVEAGFADQRTYVYDGRDVDQQTHLGFDLASTSMAPVLAANSGTVVHAGWLGIYGNCVILDHGMGLQSLYAHLSSIDVQVGGSVRMNDQLGRSGSTGLAGGDHLHFTMLLGGNAINPIDWWSAQWVEDRIMRKIAEAGR